MASKSKQFLCPHCKTLLTKSEVDQLLGEVKGFIVDGPEYEHCPGCGKPIDRLSIIRGDYDVKSSWVVKLFAWLFFGVIIMVLHRACS